MASNKPWLCIILFIGWVLASCQGSPAPKPAQSGETEETDDETPDTNDLNPIVNPPDRDLDPNDPNTDDPDPTPTSEPTNATTFNIATLYPCQNSQVRECTVKASEFAGEQLAVIRANQTVFDTGRLGIEIDSISDENQEFSASIVVKESNRDQFLKCGASNCGGTLLAKDQTKGFIYIDNLNLTGSTADPKYRDWPDSDGVSHPLFHLRVTCTTCNPEVSNLVKFVVMDCREPNPKSDDC